MLGSKYKEALASALEGKASVWHYASDFCALWSDSFGTDQPILIVWDRAALGGSDNRDDRLLEPHLTPLDWALSWSIKCANEGKGLPSIVIVDVRSDQWAGSWAWTVRRQLLADMPWVTLTAPVVRKDGASALHEWTMALQSMDGTASDAGIVRRGDGDWIVGTDWMPRQATTDEEATLRKLGNIWTASLSQSDEHHDINNIVGARILLARAEREDEGGAEDDGDLPANEARGSSVLRAFLQKVAWLQGSGDDLPPWKVWNNQWPENYLLGKQLYLTIYDDMYQSGWDTFLMHFVQEISCDAAGEDSPRELVEFITERAIFDKRDFFQNAHAGSNENPELIFLDFRLYARSDRAQFLEDTNVLLNIARRIASCGTLAWVEIGEDEIKGIENWLERGANEREHWHDQALLLLPRLLALALPLTPIILFSSTAQARIRDQLKAYRNIFTGFQKPNPLGDPASIENAISALGIALDRAMPMLRRRLQLGYVQRTAEERRRFRPKSRPKKHYEIYFDESGTNSLFSTAAIVQFKDIAEADRKSKDIISSCLSQRRRTILEKSSELNDLNIIREADFFSKFVGDPVDILSVRCNPAPDQETDLRLSNFADGHLDEAICQNLYLSVFVYVAYFGEQSTVSIHLPTRRIGEENDNTRNLYEERFGLTNDRNNNKIITYNKTSAFPLVRGWMRSWGKHYQESSKNIISIMAKSISAHDPFADYNVNWGRPLHYIADWAAGFVAYGGTTGHPKSVSLLRPKLGRNVFGGVYYSDMRSGNLDLLTECLRTIVSVDQPEMGHAISILCRVPLVKEAGHHELKKLKIMGKRQSIPQENLWLWAIFPHIAAKARGDDLLVGL